MVVLGNNIPKENNYYTCIACIAVDSVIKINKKKYPQVYLEERKYKVKKKKINTPRFINIELDSDSEPDIETDLESNTTTEN